ncbi:MAG: YbaB/EbfC family nucleoid-associated protein [Deltaproteobacteria bacterium]|jgi:DNA-binding YbaB/EbfC family protein|nr:YbaB/EbfC family nucleoid-associated protein [Deltaproteobacteria bacterium]
MDNENSQFTFNLLKQAKIIQEKINQLQQTNAQRTVTAGAGGSMVTVTANGANLLTAIKIDKSIVNPDDVEMIEDLVLAAANQALSQVQAVISDEMAKLTSSLSLPSVLT